MKLETAMLFLRERTQEIEASPEDFSKDTRREGDYDLENKVTLEKREKLKQSMAIHSNQLRRKK